MNAAFDSPVLGTVPSSNRWDAIRADRFSGAVALYELYDEMRRDSPIWSSPWRDIYVSSYDLVALGLADKRLSHAPPRALPRDHGSASAIDDWLMYQEGSAHSAIRRAFQEPFLGSGLATIRSAIDRAILHHVVKADLDGEIDVVAAFTRAIPEQVITDLLGTPDADLPLLRSWSASIRALLDTGFDGAFGGDASAADEMAVYFTEHARRLLKDGGLPPLLIGLPKIVDDLGIVVAGRNLAFLAFAGHETTVHLLGNILLHLTAEPARWQELRATPGLIENAVAETLRLESPVQKICRWSTERMMLGDHQLEIGDLVVLLIGAANRDPTRFKDPARFDLHRGSAAHLAFGRGAHVCIGRALAQMEATALLATMLLRWPQIAQVPDGATWMDNSSFRGLDRLVLRLEA